MRARVNRRAVWCALCALFASISVSVSMAASPAVAAGSFESYEAEQERWAISFALSSGFTVQEHNGAIRTDAQVLRSPLPPPAWIRATQLPGDVPDPVPLRRPVSGSFSAIVTNVGANLELMAPAFASVPGRPRAFVLAEILPSFAPVGTLALEGTGGGLIVPDRKPENFAAARITGAGSRLKAQMMTTVISARIGSAFPFELRNHRLQLRPSLGWIRYGVLAAGDVVGAFKDDPKSAQQLGEPAFGPNVREVSLHGRGASFFNAIGPGLELELELGRFGSLRPALYAEMHAFRTLGNREIRFSDSTSFREDPNDPTDRLGDTDYQAHWTVEVAPWMYRAGFGFRVRWTGR